MSDATLNRFLANGTAAERVAFIPDPPVPASGPDPGYSWYETDTGSLYAWDGAAWAIVSSGGGTGDVVGPASAVDDRIATFDGITGKLIQDSGDTIADVVADAVAAAIASIVPVDLTADVTGDLPLANLAQAAAASRLLGRGSAGGAGDWEALTIGTGLTMTGTVLSASSAAGDVVGPASAVDDQIVTFDGITGTLIQDGGKTIATVVSDAVTAAVAAIVPVDLTADVTGDLPYANLVQATGASKILVRGSAGGAGDWQEGTVGAGLSFAGTVLSASSAAAGPKTVGVTVDGGGVVVTTGQKGYAQCSISGTITSWTVLADQAGDVEFDVTLDAFGSFPPTTSIVASAPPELVGVDSDTDNTLTGWTTSVTAGDVFGFEVVGVPADVTRVTLQIVVTP